MRIYCIEVMTLGGLYLQQKSVKTHMIHMIKLLGFVKAEETSQ